MRHLLRVALGQEEIGRRIAQAREAADITQQELADRIGISTAQSISRYERGETEVPMGRLRRIADATGKPIEFFIGEALEAERVADAAAWTEVQERLRAVEAVEAQNSEMLVELLRLVRDAQEPPEQGAEDDLGTPPQNH